MNEQECYVLGLWKYDERKEGVKTGNLKIGVVLAYDEKKENYTGLTPLKMYVDFDEEKFNQLYECAKQYQNGEPISNVKFTYDVDLANKKIIYHDVIVEE